MEQIVAYYDKVTIQEARLYVEDDVIAERDHQLRLPCLWLDGNCVTDEATYVWSIRSLTTATSRS